MEFQKFQNLGCDFCHYLRKPDLYHERQRSLNLINFNLCCVTYVFGDATSAFNFGDATYEFRDATYESSMNFGGATYEFGDATYELNFGDATYEFRDAPYCY